MSARRLAHDAGSGWENAVYCGLVALLFWAPLPMGSVHPWGAQLTVIWVGALGVVWVAGWVLGKCTVPSSFYRGRLALVLLCLWATIGFVQLIPLPPALMLFISPGSAAAYGNFYGATAPGWIPITIDASITWQRQLLTLALVGYFALALLVIRRTDRLKHFALMLVLSGIVCSVLALYLHFTGASYTLFFQQMTHEAAKGPFVNRNHLAAYLEICLGCGAGLIVADFVPAPMRTWKQRLRWLFALLLSSKARVRLLLIVMVIALILTRSRGGNAAFFAALIAGGFVALLCLRAGWKSIVIFICSMLILDLVVIGSWIGIEHVVNRVQQTAMTSEAKQAQGLTEESVEERSDQAFAALPSVKTFPLLGAGAGTFEVLYTEYKKPGYLFTLNYAHNDYLEFLFESGPLGILLLTLFFGVVFARGIVTLIRPSRASRVARSSP